MNNEEKQILITQILDTLTRTAFQDWYNAGRFNDWLHGEIDDEQIQNDIEKLFFKQSKS